MLEPKAEVGGKEPSPPMAVALTWLGRDSSKDRKTDSPIFLVIIFHTPLVVFREGGSGTCMFWMQRRQKLTLTLKIKK